MAFLTINGWSVPVRDGGECDDMMLGKIDRSINGNLQIQHQGYKRSWKFQTPPVDLATARALIGMLHSQGDMWSFRNYTRGVSTPTAAQIASDKGVVNGTTTTATLQNAFGADGSSVAWLYTAPTTYCNVYPPTYHDSLLDYGSSCALLNDTGGTNLLTANQSSVETNDTGFTAEGTPPVCTRTTVGYFIGSASLSLETDASTEGFYVACAASGSTQYTGSLYVRATGTARSMTLKLVSTGGASPGDIGTPTTFTPVVGTWIRVGTTGTTPSDATGVRMYLLSATASSTTCYVDGLQVQTGNVATGWVTGGSSRTSYEILPTPSWISTLHGHEVTIACWTKRRLKTGSYDYLVGMEQNGVQNRLILHHNNTDHQVGLTLYANNGAAAAIYSGSEISSSAWTHVAGVYSPHTSPYLQLFINGVSVATNTSLTSTNRWVNFNTVSQTANSMAIAVKAGGTFISDLVIVPYRMHADQIAALASTSYRQPKFPFLLVSGDSPMLYGSNAMQANGATGVPGYLCIGEVSKSTLRRVAASPAYTVVEFKLHEAEVSQ